MCLFNIQYLTKKACEVKMLTTNEATKFCKIKHPWRFKYAARKAGIKPVKTIGMAKMWDEKDLTQLIKENEND